MRVDSGAQLETTDAAQDVHNEDRGSVPDSCARASDPLSCGDGCVRCPVPANAVATCVTGVCGVECVAGSARKGQECRPVPPPRLRAPLSGSNVSSGVPVLRYVLPASASGGEVELSRRADFFGAIRVRSIGESVSPTAALDPGVWFWRVRALFGERLGAEPSVTWTLRVVGSARTGVVLPGIPDLDGDGRSELIVGAPASNSGVGAVYIYRSGRLSAPHWVLTAPAGSGPNFGRYVSYLGDINGDGVGDLLCAADGPLGEGTFSVYQGQSSGSPPALIHLVRGSRAMEVLATEAAAGDINADGYGDVVVLSRHSGTGAGALLAFMGGSTGIGTSAAQTWVREERDSVFGGSVQLGDFDLDGFGDVLTDAANADRSVHSVLLARGRTSGMDSASPLVVVNPDAQAQRRYAVSMGADYNEDGRPDLVLATLTSMGVVVKVGPLISLGFSAINVFDGRSTTAPLLQNPSIFALRAGDLDGDRQLDWLVGVRDRFIRVDSGPANALSVVIAHAVGTNPLPGSVLFPLGSVAATADVFGNEIDDLVVGDPAAEGGAGVVRVYAGQPGGPSNVPALTIPAPTSSVRGFGTSIAQ
jgi:hypothetical protein